MKIIIIGGSHAGIACAVRARKEFPNSEIIIYERQSRIGFVAQSIPLYLSGDNNFSKMSSYIKQKELEDLDIYLKVQEVVIELDMDNKLVKSVNLTNQIESQEGYDKLVLAMGSYPSLPLAQVQSGKNFFTVKKFEDAEKIKKFIDESKSVIIIGGGAIGSELSRVISGQKLKVTLLHSSEYILNRYLDNAIAKKIEKSLVENGVDIHTKSIAEYIYEEENPDHSGSKRRRVVTKGGAQYVADGVIYAAGFRPNTYLVAGKLELGDKGAIIVDDYMQTSQKDVYAVGDCSTTLLTNVKKPRYVPHASDAIRQGEVAAINLAKPVLKIIHSQGTYKLNFDSENTICMTGLSLKKAEEEGFDAAVAYVQDKYINGNYYFELWLVYEKDTYKILGMQSRGSAPEIGPQADIISLAIQNKMTVNELEYSDFYFRHGFRNPKSFTKMIADEIRENEQR